MRNEFAKVSDPNDFVSCSGDPVRVLYSSVVRDDGVVVLTPCGTENLQEKINSFRELTDMSFILARMQAGNMSDFRTDTPMFGDFTQMPKTYAEVLQLQLDAEKKFMELPVEVRDSFNHDFRQWMAKAGNDEWLKKMDPVLIHKEEQENVEECDQK